MSRNGSGVYSLPAGSTVVNGDTSDATDVNTPLADIEADLNVARPIVAGGTGATSAGAARTNLDVPSTSEVTAEIAVLEASVDADIADLTTIGAHTVYLPSLSMTPTVTNGATFVSQELATNDIMASGYDFDASTEEKLQFVMAMPKSWNEGTLSAQFAWKDAATAGAGFVVWGVRMASLGDGDAMDASFGTAIIAGDSFQTSGDLHITAQTSPVTPSGTPAEGDFIVVEVYRDATNGSDTYTQDARLLGVKLIFTTDAGTDD